MLHSIRTRREEPSATHEPLDLLTSCHGRLRHFSQLSLALVTRRDIDEAQIVDAAHRLLRYFQVALPLHEADEEQTIAPALAPLVTPAQADAVARMTDQHALLHDVLAELFSYWERAKAEPLATDLALAAPHARRLAAVLDVHLELEESTIFPALASIPDADRKRMFDEMRARRSAEVMTEMRSIAH